MRKGVPKIEKYSNSRIASYLTFITCYFSCHNRSLGALADRIMTWSYHLVNYSLPN